MQLFGLKISRKTQEQRALPADYNAILTQIQQGSGTGSNVTAEKAMGFAAVYRAVELRSETVASLPIQIIEIVNGNRSISTTDPLLYYLGTRPNEAMGAFTFWQTFQMHMDLWGDGIATINYNNGRIEGFTIKHPADADIYNYKGTLFYNFKDEPRKTYRSDEVLHVPGLGFDGIRGKSRIAMHRETIAGGLAATVTNSKFWLNGAFFRGILQMPGFLKDKDKAAKISTDFQNTWGGGNSWGVPVLQGGAEFKPISMPHRDAQYIEGIKFTVEEVARIFNVPLHKLKSMDGAKFSNVEQMQIEWVVDTVRPMVKRIENELEIKILVRGQNKRIKFNIDGLLRGDLKTRAQYYKDMFFIGALSPNEIRATENLNARDGGDEFFTPVNMYSNEQLDKIVKEIGNDGQ